ncbi:hypothetical protein FKM82_022663 [Ascaphus truei]
MSFNRALSKCLAYLSPRASRVCLCVRARFVTHIPSGRCHGSHRPCWHSWGSPHTSEFMKCKALRTESGPDFPRGPAI